MPHVPPQVGAPDPELNTSPIGRCVWVRKGEMRPER